MPAIIGPFPANIAAGQDVSAAPVMANFNWIQSQVNANVPVTPTLSRVQVTAAGGSAAMTSAVERILGLAINNGTILIDTLGEFSTTTGKFTAQRAGYYLFTATGQCDVSGATFTGGLFIRLFKNAAQICQPVLLGQPLTGVIGMGSTNTAVVQCAANDTLYASLIASFTGALAFYSANVTIVGLD